MEGASPSSLYVDALIAVNVRSRALIRIAVTIDINRRGILRRLTVWLRPLQILQERRCLRYT